MPRRHPEQTKPRQDSTFTSAKSLPVAAAAARPEPERTEIEMSTEIERLLADLKALAALTTSDRGAQRLAWTPVWDAARGWYRERLAPRFREAGLGFWVRRGAPLTLWELERQ